MFPSEKGTYVLILMLAESSEIAIGKLGTFGFEAGCYAYVGSAFGRGGLAGRLKHHLRSVRKPHWHIDYLRQAGQVCEVWSVASETVYEHEWAGQLSAMAGAKIPVVGFGASDCRCVSHLIYMPQKPQTKVLSDIEVSIEVVTICDEGHHHGSGE